MTDGTGTYPVGTEVGLQKAYNARGFSFSLVFKIGLVLMVFRLIGSHLISHLALRQSQSIIPSLHSLLFPVVYPKVPYLAHSFSPFYSLYYSSWLGDLKKFPQIPFVCWWHPAVHLFHSYKFCSMSWNTYHHFHWHSFLDELEQTAPQSI